MSNFQEFKEVSERIRRRKKTKSPKTTGKVYWAGINHNKIHTAIIGTALVKVLFIREKDAKDAYPRIRKVRIEEVR